MKRHLLLLVALCALSSLTGLAAVFSTSPKLLQESSKNVKIFFDANESGVAGLQKATEIYAHIGVTLTSDPSAWTHVKGTWDSNTADKKFTKNAQGLWELNIGDIRTYFGMTNANEKVAKIAVIARTPKGDAQTGDTFIDVLDEGFQMSIEYDAASLVLNAAKTINFTVNVTEPSTITLSVDGTQIGSVSNSTLLTKSHNFSQKGKFYTVKATASNGTTSLSKELTVAYPEPSVQAAYPGGRPKQGAVKNADGTVTFCIAAPGKSSVILVPSWDDYQTLNKNVMKYHDYQGFRYFWITTTEKLKDNEYYPYYYLVDGTIKVADPYAKLMLDCYSDKWLPTGCFENMPKYPYEKFDDTMLAVYRGDIDDYNWDDATKNFNVPDRRSLTIYELLLRDFTGDGSDQDGKKFGTFRTALPKVQYLADLGVNAVELLPVMEFNGNNSWGYNTNGYMALDKAYGSPRDMRDFIAECHRHGIAVILDIVFNQSDGLHPWYQMYDIKSNPFFNETAPHAYSVLNDWKQDYPLVTQHWKDVLTYWMEAYKVDGFRFDLVKGLGLNSSYGNTDSYNASRVAKMKELHAAIKAVNPDAIHINELLGDDREENEMGDDGQLNWKKVNEPAYQYCMGDAKKVSQVGNTKGFCTSNWNHTIGETVDYAESHDEPRVANKVKTEGATGIKYSGSDPRQQAIQRLGSLAAQMLMCPGSKMIWQFGEIAADDDQGSDLDKLRPIAPKWEQYTMPGRAALYENYRQLCNMRLKNPDMFTGEATCTHTGFNNDFTTTRSIRLTKGDKEIIAFFNPAITGTKTVTATATRLNANNCQLITAAYKVTPTLTGTGTSVSVSLPSNSFAVFATKTVSDIEEIGSEISGSEVSVYAEAGRIVIDGEYETAEVFNLQGISFPSLEVPAGLYIVRVDGSPFKVLVK